MKQILLLLSLFFAVSVNAQKKIIITGGGGGIDSVTIYERTDSIFYDFGDGERFAFKVSNVDTTGAFVTAVEWLDDSTAVAWKGGVPEILSFKGVQNLQSVTDRDSITTRKVTVRDFAISDVPKFDNNDSALANGLSVGDVYKLPYDTVKKAYLLAITDLPPPPDSLLLRILTNNAGATLPWANQAAFESAMAADNPSLSVSSYSLVGDELTVLGTGLVKIPNNECANISDIIEVESETVQTIGDNAFESCLSLVTIDFPAATAIGDNAFESSGSLVTVYFPAATAIGDYAFQSSGFLVTVDFPAATAIGDYAFENCGSLVTVDFPAATAIGDYAFEGCTSLVTVGLANFPLVDYWGDNALTGCTSLTTFETNATTIRPSVLADCESLIDVTLNSATALFDIFGGSAYVNGKGSYNMTFTMPNLNNIINDPFAEIISNGIIGGGTDFTITIPSAMTGNAKILDAQSAGAIIVGL